MEAPTMGPYRSLLTFLVAALIVSPAWGAKAIQHDAEHYVLLHQYADQWAAEDEEIDQRLAQIREWNGSKRPRSSVQMIALSRPFTIFSTLLRVV